MTFSIIVVLSRGIENDDRQTVFKTCFARLISQEYSKQNFEVVLVDSGSEFTHQAVENLKSQGKRFGVEVIFLQPDSGNIGPARARNLGIKAVSSGQTKLRSQIIALTDDDTLVPIGWLRQLENGYKNFPQASGVGGLTLSDENLSAKNIFALYDKFIYDRYPRAEGPSKNINEHPVFSGNISYKREILEQVGGFDESYAPYIYGEDADLKERVVKNGGFLVFVGAVNLHLARYNWKRFIRQQESRGAGILKYRLKHSLGFPSRWELVIKLLSTPVVSLFYFVQNYEDLRIFFLETLAYFFRQLGKIKYYNRVLDCHSGPRAGIQEPGSQIKSGMTGNDDSKNRTKILFVDHTPLIGGSQLALLRHLKHLDKSSFSVAVATSFDYPIFNEELRLIDGISVNSFEFPQIKTSNPIQLIHFLVTCFNLIKVAGKEDSQVLVANTERAFYACFIVSLVLNRKLILLVRDFEYSKILLKLTAFKVTRFICVSKNIQSFYGFDRLKSSVIYVGSNLDEKLKEVNVGQEQEPRSILAGSRSDDLIIGFVGRLIAWKGPELLLKSFARLCGRHGNLKLVFVGDGPLKAQLQILADSLGVKDKVHFAGFTSDVATWYKIFNLFVHASIKAEPFATTVIEAALAGLPIIATDTGGTAEFVENRVNGLLVSPEEGSLVTALELFINDENLRSKLGFSAKQKAQNNFTEKKITKELETIYDII